MHFIINEKILSIPPYISTNWDHICSLHLELENGKNILVISLQNGTLIRIPNLDNDVLTKIFQKHTQFLELKTKKGSNEIEDSSKLFNMENMIGLGFPMRFGGSLEGLGAAMQHNPDQSNAPDLPTDVLEKISAISKIMDNDQNLKMSLKPEPHCNCIHCQIAKIIQGDSPKEEIEEEVTDDDLRFRTWDIVQSGEKLYSVSSPLDSKEQYSVFLGEPLGCTCGQKNCEHIKAVLNT